MRALVCTAVLLFLGGAAAAGQVVTGGAADQIQVRPLKPEPTTGPTSLPAIDPNEVAATVNGTRIMESDVQQIVRSRTPAPVLQNPNAAGMLKQFRARVVETMIDTLLVEQVVERDKIEISEAELDAALEQELKTYLLANAMAREEFEARMLMDNGLTVDEFMKGRRADPAFARAQRINKWLRAKHPEINVTDDEIKAYYERELDRRFNRPERMRARRILIQVDAPGEEGKAAARAKAEDILARARQPGADFAALARAHSTAPSAAIGGEMGYLTRDGRVEPAIVEVVFALKPGEVSSIIESAVGLSIVQAVDYLPPEKFEFEAVAEGIRFEMMTQKLRELQRNEALELRKAAKIEYAEGKEPPGAVTSSTQQTTQAATTRPATTRPAGMPSGAPSQPPATQPAR